MWVHPTFFLFSYIYNKEDKILKLKIEKYVRFTNENACSLRTKEKE